MTSVNENSFSFRGDYQRSVALTNVQLADEEFRAVGSRYRRLLRHSTRRGKKPNEAQQRVSHGD
jgi:hypothetical protein